MTALTQERMREFERWTYHGFTLAAGNKAYKHAAVGLDPATGKVNLMGPTPAGLIYIGLANRTVDATAADKPIDVNLCREIEVEFWASAGGITKANIGQLAYFVDDNTVGLTDNGALAGRIWAYDAVGGVGVEKLQAPDAFAASGGAAVQGGGAGPDAGGRQASSHADYKRGR